MPYTHGYATGFDDLISQIISWSTDASIHGADAWELIRNDPWPRGTILKGRGFQEGEHFYVGLMPLAIQKGQTYRNWFMQKQILATHFVWSKKGLGMPGTPFDFNISNYTIVPQTGSDNPINYYSLPFTPDIFYSSAQALFLGMFKQYAPALDWHEQPGGMTFPDVPLQPIYYTSSTSGTRAPFVPPMFPGTGYPALGMDLSGPIDQYLEYWLTKDAHRLIMIMKNREYWDMAYLGFLEPYHTNTQYAFPAVVIGGTSGAIISGEDVTINYYSYPIASTGIQFDYRPVNWALSHGIPTFSGAPTDAKQPLSQVRLMLPDGRWQPFANWVQGITILDNANIYGSVASHSFARAEPARAVHVGHYLRPACTDLDSTKHVYRTDKDRLTYQLEPLEFVEDAGDVHNLFGRAWRVYWPSNRITQYGEMIIDGKLHIMLPNVWENRRWSISNGRTNTTDPDVLLEQENKIEKMSQQMNCLVRLED